MTETLFNLLFSNIPQFGFAIIVMYMCDRRRALDADKYMEIISHYRKLLDELLDPNRN